MGKYQLKTWIARCELGREKGKMPLIRSLTLRLFSSLRTRSHDRLVPAWRRSTTMASSFAKSNMQEIDQGGYLA